MYAICIEILGVIINRFIFIMKVLIYKAQKIKNLLIDRIRISLSVIVSVRHCQKGGFCYG